MPWSHMKEVRRLSCEPNLSFWSLGTAASACSQPLFHPLSLSLAPAESTIAGPPVPLLFESSQTTYPSWPHFPPQSGPRGWSIQLCVMLQIAALVLLQSSPGWSPVPGRGCHHPFLSSYLFHIVNRKVPETGQLIRFQVNMLQLHCCLATL